MNQDKEQNSMEMKLVLSLNWFYIYLNVVILLQKQFCNNVFSEVVYYLNTGHC